MTCRTMFIALSALVIARKLVFRIHIFLTQIMLTMLLVTVLYNVMVPTLSNIKLTLAGELALSVDRLLA